MTEFLSLRNLKFLLYEVLDTLALSEYAYFREHSREIYDALFDTGMRIARQELVPYLTEMDRQPPEFVEGGVTVHPSIRAFLREAANVGAISGPFPEELGGFQLPLTISNALGLIFGAANYSSSVYPFLTSGAAGLIIAFGDDTLIKTFIPRMFSGEWQGTMALTEPGAGSSLADLQTTATPAPDGGYRIRGRKVFTSAGDHDAVENVVHLMLARIEGAPPGVAGISLFVVPKLRIGEDGQLVSNDVAVSELYHKMGYKGAPIMALSIGDHDDCHGYLVGEAHQGLRYMFHMMNEARIAVGFGGAAIASTAYHIALKYTQERLQGRQPSERNLETPQIAIIEHADVRRMLLFQRAVIEGSLSLLFQCSLYADLLKVLPEGAEKERVTLLLDILTPVAKTYPAEMGIQAVSQAVQCLGGYGYVDDFAVEQLYRDARIHPIHEGTTGIQGKDLLGRKVGRDPKAYQTLRAEVMDAVESAQGVESLNQYAEDLSRALEVLDGVTDHLRGIAARKGPDYFLADATLYLELFGNIVVGWQWLRQGLTAQRGLESAPSDSDRDFYQGKLLTLRYFYTYELPRIKASAAILLKADGLTVDLDSAILAS